ncbi:putative ATP-grasp-modified RiPP [Natronosporangium hydrolyticum]|uniref:Putative ATP-grasp-modified RiPP n=1 Tax=Natronosporangium hydrolyticum TaxID=2811111 RepID=A0A895YEM4_9ACTN|nr:putative ATP-grasp-modified RiPP [Natronosporangium hydrolyticum]QSB14595.1 putative ATP-grasp-modified RiPP [Natronosporangium hydrolyticum]
MPTAPDPLVAASERFALGRPRFAPVDASDSASSLRPFGLRFATAPLPAPGLDQADWSICPDRQIAIHPNGADILDMTQRTTGPSGDGNSGGGAEEWGPDNHHDDGGIPA